MNRLFFLLFFILIIALPSLARQGCCSHHGGVCGCGCCDGTSLSTTCAPYYPHCSNSKGYYGTSSSIKQNKTTNTSTSDYEKKINQLEAQIIKLQKEINILTSQRNLNTTPKPLHNITNNGNWKIKSNWRTLQQGINKSQIKQILGEPDNISVFNLVGETWWYGSGNLNLSTNGTLNGWSEPEF